jgi:hypothetical protein
MGGFNVCFDWNSNKKHFFSNLMILPVSRLEQGCQTVYFQTKIPKMSIFWRPLNGYVGIFYDCLEYFTNVGYIYGHLVYLVVIGYIFSRFGLMYKKIWQPFHLKRKLFDKNVLQTATPIRNQLQKIIRMIILKLFLHQNF